MVTARTTLTPPRNAVLSGIEAPDVETEWEERKGMPFHKNVYYPYELETTQLAPSLLTLPLLPRPSSTINNMPSSSHGPVFKFRARNESVDWRRIGAIDVDRVANELDFVTLQDNIMSITFCNVENEKCPHCYSNLNPILVKLFRLAQYTIEYLLHSQEYLTSNLQAVEEKVQAGLRETEDTNLKLAKQCEVMKSLKEECKRRKMVIATQQIIINSSANSYHKCQYCDKAFMNCSFLQSHIQRRHPAAASSEKHIHQASEKLQHEMGELQKELHIAKCQLEAEQRLSKLQETKHSCSIEQDIAKKFDHWKQEEQIKLSEEMRKVKEMFMKEFEELTKKNRSLEQELQELIKDNQQLKSNLGPLQANPKRIAKEVTHKCSHDCDHMQQLLEIEENKWLTRMQHMEKEHETEKSKLMSQTEKLKLSVSQDQRTCNDYYKKRLAELQGKLLEQEELITAQNEQIKELSVKPSPEVRKHPANPVPQRNAETKPHARDCDLEKAPSTTKQHLFSALKKNPALTKELRLVLEQGLAEKMEALGIKQGVRGITSDRMHQVLGAVQSCRGEKEKLIPEIQVIRDNLSRWVSFKAEQALCSRPPSQTSTDVKVPPITSTPSTYKPPVLKSAADEFKHKHRYILPVNISVPKTKPVYPKDATKISSVTTSPFSSFDESENDNYLLSFKPDTLEQSTSFVRDDFEASGSDSEGSLLEEFDRKMLNRNRSNMPTPAKPPRATMVKGLTEKIEKQLSSRGVENKPTGGIDVAHYNTMVTTDPVMEMKVSDIEDSSFDSTSLEEDPQSENRNQDASKYKTKSAPAPAKNVNNLTKLSKGDVREADTSSTLISSLVTVSDFSDSD